MTTAVRRFPRTIALLSATFASRSPQDAETTTSRPRATSQGPPSSGAGRDQDLPARPHHSAQGGDGQAAEPARRTTTRWPRPSTSTTRGCCARSAREVARFVKGAQADYKAANPAYEEMEGVVAGVPELADFDVIIDAGADKSDPENAVPFSIKTPAARPTSSPGTSCSSPRPARTAPSPASPPRV